MTTLEQSVWSAAACVMIAAVLTTLRSDSVPTPTAAHFDEVVFIGACDASAVVPLSAHTFALANDEDNILRVYDAVLGGVPLYEHDISTDIGLEPRPPGKDGRLKPPPEADIEAATRMGEHAFWLSSHSRSGKGKLKSERLRFFATRLPSYRGAPRVVGKPYAGLVDALSVDPRYAALGLSEAAEHPPKTERGLNIEGMTLHASGGVLVGLRAPAPRGQALLFVIENPRQVIDGDAPRFSDPILLDIGGLGIRALSRWHDRYLIVAGDWGESRPSRLFVWDGHSKQLRAVAIGEHLEGFNPESIFVSDERGGILLLSDDGTKATGGRRCKDLPHLRHKRFRGRWLAASSIP